MSCAVNRLPKPHAVTENSWSKGSFSSVSHFAGPGWKKGLQFRARPQDGFDLAAKIHDAAYDLNALEIGSRPTLRLRPVGANTFAPVFAAPPAKGAPGRSRPDPGYSAEEQRLISRFYKADTIFLIMTAHYGPTTNRAAVLNWLAGQVFLTDPSYARTDDGFCNPLTDRAVMSALSMPRNYLMIPYCDLRGAKPVGADGAPDWYAEHDDDSRLGFQAWLNARYGPVLSRLQAF